MTERRTPRASLQNPSLEIDQAEVPPVSPALVEHLERTFPVTLSPNAHPNNVFADQATQRGQQSVIDYLRNFTRKQQEA